MIAWAAAMSKVIDTLLLTVLATQAVTTQADRSSDVGQPDDDRFGPATWQVESHNDAYADSDNQFTAGLSVRKHSDLAARLAETSGTPAFGKWMARWFLPDDSSLHYRESWTVGQNLQTPDDLRIEHIVLNDVPYVGMAGWSNSFTAFDDTRFTGFGLLLGWTGEGALGEESQKLAHRITGANEPQGWDHQLDFEPLLNVYFMKKRKLWRLPKFDGAVDVGLAAGNFFTYGQAALEMRIGDAPRGFAFVPVPIGRGLDYDARLTEAGEASTYLSLVVRGTRFVHALPRDGNTLRNGNEWTENNTINPERLVGQVLLGFHHERARWGVHLHFSFSTDTIEDGDGLFPTENPRNSFGSLTVEWRS